MKQKRYSTEQIVAAMKQHELGAPASTQPRRPVALDNALDRHYAATRD